LGTTPIVSGAFSLDARLIRRLEIVILPEAAAT
jgi:hypothetical protein